MPGRANGPAPSDPGRDRARPDEPRRDRPPSGPSRPPRGGAVQIDPVLVEVLAGLVWLTVGSLGLDAAGAGTLLLAAGIAAGGWILVENRRRGSMPFDPARSVELLRLVGGAVAAAVVVSILFGLIGWGAFAPGVAAAVTGGALLMLSASTGQRATRWLGVIVALLGVLSVFVATQSTGGVVSQGVIGIVVGLLLLASGADRVGLLETLRDRFG